MGTSNPFDGPDNRTPLVPTWLDSPELLPKVPPEVQPQPPAYPPIVPPAEPNRFRSARGNFSRFAKSNGDDSASFRRAVSQYVGTSAGGSRNAAVRMGASRAVSRALVGFLSDASNHGSQAALQRFNLGALANRPIEEIFLGLAEHVCPEGGSVDQGIARDAFIETIASLAEAGVTDLDHLTPEQIETVFEIYATNAIVARLCNDIGARAISLPSSPRDAERLQGQIRDFIQRGVADAVQAIRGTSAAPILAGQVEDVYRQTFEILVAMSEEEASDK